MQTMGKIVSSLEYEKDFYGWIYHNIGLLKERKFQEINVDLLVEELEGMAKRDKRELVSRFMVLIAHLLKWEFQDEKRSSSWKGSIREQRIQIIDQLVESPSLKGILEECVKISYSKAITLASDETGLSTKAFPQSCKYTIEQLLDESFYPGNI